MGVSSSVQRPQSNRLLDQIASTLPWARTQGYKNSKVELSCGLVAWRSQLSRRLGTGRPWEGQQGARCPRAEAREPHWCLWSRPLVLAHCHAWWQAMKEPCGQEMLGEAEQTAWNRWGGYLRPQEPLGVGVPLLWSEGNIWSNVGAIGPMSPCREDIKSTIGLWPREWQRWGFRSCVLSSGVQGTLFWAKLAPAATWSFCFRPSLGLHPSTQ